MLKLGDTLPLRFHIVLKAISDYIEEFGTSPYHKNNWVMERTGYESNHITQIKGELVKANYLDKNTHLTPKGKEYIRKHFGPFVVKSIEIRVQGTATAGPSEMTASINDLFVPSENTVNVPCESSTKDVFALLVKGISMKAEGILDGDYLIVEKQDSLWWPDPNDLIVTTYLPYEIKPTALEYQGPTVKIYLRRVGEKGCELGWKRNNETNPYIILALDLKPIGKVIGIYRNTKKFSFQNID
jgi:SOS-response transcriptional repressor LexA